MKRNKFCLFLFVACMVSVYANDTIPTTYDNPILPGFHPDPSICRVGDDYYLVTSSFEWFPGVPIYHSKDLVNWQHIGNVLERPEQLDLQEGHRHNGGIWAPTIRYHDGLFFMITTCAGKGNFYVTATDPAGPWSDPVWLEARGIDPSLFWDDDGRCWYTGAAHLSGSPQWPNQNGVYIQEIDLDAKKMIGEPVQMTHGHALNARWTEGPHLYKIDGRYLLIVAEGGTGKDHAVTVFESENITGPYIPGHTNPVLTHRHLGEDFPLGMLGHADLVETQNGEWWAVLLGRRVQDGVSMLARETFLVPVEFKDGWPIFNKGIGRVLLKDKRPHLDWHPFAPRISCDDFAQKKLAPYWNFLRTPTQQWYHLDDDALHIQARAVSLTDLGNPSFIARRIQHYNYVVTTNFNFQAPSGEAGLSLFLDNENHYRLAKKKNQIQLIKVQAGHETVVASRKYDEKSTVLQVKCNMFDVQFLCGKNMQSLEELGGIQDARVITAKSFIGMGFNGPYVGMYAVSDVTDLPVSFASFDWFSYQPN